MLRRLPIIALAIQFVSCEVNGRWEGSDRFIRELRCGMTKEDVRAIVERHALGPVTQNPEGTEILLWRERTSFRLTFRTGSLAKVEEWHKDVRFAKQSTARAPLFLCDKGR